jgi:hypothetical protein
VVVSFFGTGSGVAEGCADGGTSGFVTVREFAFSFTGLIWFRGLAAAGLAAIATFLDFTVLILAPGLNGARFGSIGVVAAVLVQPCKVQVCTIPRGGTGRLQPIKIAHSAQMKNSLINSFPSWAKSHSRGCLEGDNETMKINNENRRTVWR